MPTKDNEAAYEAEICAYLADHGWLYSPNDTGYEREHALFPEDIFAWLEDTQPQELEKLRRMHNGDTEPNFLKRLVDLIEKDGALSILRHGFKHLNARFDLMQPRPANTLNPETWDRYRKNRVRIMRQVHYSSSNGNSIDLVVFVNGIPVATMELKTDFKQSVHDAIHQYREDRPPKDPKTKRPEPLLTFNRGALVHFAVSTDEVWMTTRLTGSTTHFRPFNLGHDGGRGNPPNPRGYRTAYLWEQILDRDTWLTILAAYVHMEHVERRGPDGKKWKTDNLIFPRIHQWQAVSQCVSAAREEGPGHTYLIQHSAGSGKTNSIAWLAHQLSALHGADDQKIFHSVLVVTDRTVLDQQLQDAIYQFEHKQGVVARITDEDGSKTAKMVAALAQGTPIIVVTLQTFPYVLQALRDQPSGLKDRRFAVIADEAHSSMTGSSATKLKAVLATDGDPEETEEWSMEDWLAAEMASRQFPTNTSFFAFTATPKSKTLELFGRRPDPTAQPGPTNLPRAFHVYTMQQAIEEEYILDVLKNYTPYQLAWQLAHNGRDYTDHDVDKHAGLKAIGRWVRLHPYNIAQKIQVIVEHFREQVAWRLDGRAKAMVVTSSRKEAVRYKLALDRYIREQGYTNLAALVAFSGEVSDPESGREDFSEHNMNPGLRGQDIREAFDTPAYNVLLVANKYQTGFDQPQLVAMYVDKKLAGVAAVQTLSRLNRTHPGKDTTFVLDFVNNPDDILAAFLPYYREARLQGVTDPNILHDMQDKLDRSGIYHDSEVLAFCEALFDPRASQADLQRIMAPAVDRFRGRYRAAQEAKDQEQQDALDLFRKDLAGFVRTYEFLAQIFDYGDSELEQHYHFFKALGQLLKEEYLRQEVDLTGVLLTHYRLKEQETRSLKLGGESQPLRPLSGIGSGSTQDDEAVPLSELIAAVNELFEGELTDADRIAYVDHVVGKLLEKDHLKEQARYNTKEQFSLGSFNEELINTVIEGLDHYQAMASQVLGNERVRSGFTKLIRDLVYDRLAKDRPGPPNDPNSASSQRRVGG